MPFAATSPRAAGAIPLPRAAQLAVAICLLAAVAGYLASFGRAPHDAELVPLLRFMAAVKAGMALLAVALVCWRLRFPMRPGLAAAAIGGAALMAAAPGMIWQMQHMILAAVLFHGGLLLLLGLGWADRDGSAQALRAVISTKALRAGSSTKALRAGLGRA
jgi:hypothetical protein